MITFYCIIYIFNQNIDNDYYYQRYTMNIKNEQPADAQVPIVFTVDDEAQQLYDKITECIKKNAYLCAKHANRITITKSDIELAYKLMQNRYKTIEEFTNVE